MKGNRRAETLHIFCGLCLLAGCVLLMAMQLPAQAARGTTGADTVPVLMVSDIHFEPFWDPGKTQRLFAAPIAEWNTILAAPSTAGQSQSFAALQQTCKASGVDTSYTLFASSLKAMRADARGAKFITLSGDLMSHKFACKFETLFPHAQPGEYRAFAEKTVDYVMMELRGAFPRVPVYAALGNNDTDCDDNRLNAHGEFLAGTGKAMTADLPAPEQSLALATFAAGGYYAAALPAPMRHTRLLVLDDLFMSAKYSTCPDRSNPTGGKPNPTEATEQIAWLREQLDAARREHEKVWVMGHIPSGVDPYSSILKLVQVCSGATPVMFLSSETLPETLAEYGDVVRLVIFGHTHMDEMRLLKPSNGSVDRNVDHGPVAVKVVPSISPVVGNNPSFTVARIDPVTAEMADYKVVMASNQTGVDTTWTEEYDYAKAYSEPSFTASAVADLISRFKADSTAQTSVSQSYLRDYFVGNRSMALKLFWRQYTCALTNGTADSYRACACSSTP
jgi:sphingomyelin phosphodiesterase acid-like 3